MSEKREPTELEILNGKCRLEIKLSNGQPELLELLLLNLRQVQAFMKAQKEGDQAAAAEIVANKPKGWSDSIPVGECFRIIEVGERLSIAPFSEFLRFGPVQEEILGQMLAEAKRLASLASSLTSASPPE